MCSSFRNYVVREQDKREKGERNGREEFRKDRERIEEKEWIRHEDFEEIHHERKLIIFE